MGYSNYCFLNLAYCDKRPALAKLTPCIKNKPHVEVKELKGWENGCIYVYRRHGSYGNPELEKMADIHKHISSRQVGLYNRFVQVYAPTGLRSTQADKTISHAN